MAGREFVLTVFIMIALTNNIQAGNSVVQNGSFEADGEISSISSQNSPRQWYAVNLPSGFGGWVKNDWSTYTPSGYCLSLYTKWDITCQAGDMAVVSQRLYLEDVTTLYFDLKLSASAGVWNEAERSAVILINDTPVWDSSDWAPDSSDEYHNQPVDVSAFAGTGLHKLSLAIKSDIDTVWPFIEYRAHWDFVKFDTHCGGFGYLPADLNDDCYVNFLDVKVLREEWLKVDPNERCDLYNDGNVDFLDFAVLADQWMYNTHWENWQDDNCFDIGIMSTDLDLNGIVNFIDFSILAEDWNDGSVDYNDISRMNEEWLQ